MEEETKRHCGKGTGYPKRLKVECTVKTSYKYYKKHVPKQIQVDYSEYMAISNLFFKKFMDKILLNSEEMKLPLGLGTIKVVKIKFNPELEIKPTVLTTDWVQSKKYGKWVPFVNEHSNYASYKFVWNKKSANIENKSIYVYKAIRQRKRQLASLLKTGQKEYFNCK